VVGVTLRNIGTAPITSLAATLPRAPGGPTAPYSFVFNVSSSNPLQPGQSIQQTRTLIGAGFDSSLRYPLTVNGSLANGTRFSFVEQIQDYGPLNILGWRFTAVRDLNRHHKRLTINQLALSNSHIHPRPFIKARRPFLVIFKVAQNLAL